MEIITFSVLAMTIWLVIWKIACRGPLSWASPAALFAGGLITFYVFPSLYWQFRPWNYLIPSYFDGLPIVLLGTLGLAPAFLWASLFEQRKHCPPKPLLIRSADNTIKRRVWVLLVPCAIGMAWHLYLITLGYQERFVRQTPTLFGSDTLAFLVGNVAYYYPVCYFGLVGFGNPFTRRVGQAVWLLDAFLTIITLHRYAILVFLARSVIFLTILGWRPQWRHKVVALGVVLITVGVLGESSSAANEVKLYEKAYLGPRQVFEVLLQSATRYLNRDTSPGWSSSAADPLIGLVDDTMYRLYDARSASAVMAAIPDVIPYYHGATFQHILYSLIPRYFWENKPAARDIHVITTQVMPGDLGVNPLGTVAEFYLNFGYVGILLGGLVCWLLCRAVDSAMIGGGRFGPAWICFYPILAEMLFASNFNFTQRVMEALHGLIVLVALNSFFRRPAMRAQLAQRAAFRRWRRRSVPVAS